MHGFKLLCQINCAKIVKLTDLGLYQYLKLKWDEKKPPPPLPLEKKSQAKYRLKYNLVDTFQCWK